MGGVIDLRILFPEGKLQYSDLSSLQAHILCALNAKEYSLPSCALGSHACITATLFTALNILKMSDAAYEYQQAWKNNSCRVLSSSSRVRPTEERGEQWEKKNAQKDWKAISRI